MVRHYLQTFRYDSNGSFSTELDGIEIVERDPNKVKFTKDMFGFYFFDRNVETIEGMLQLVFGEETNVSPTYVKGKKISLEKFKSDYTAYQKYEDVISICENKGLSEVVITDVGFCIPFCEDTQLI